MQPQELQDFIEEALFNHAEEEGVSIESLATFEDAGVLTRNKGLVITIGGNEYQLTISE